MQVPPPVETEGEEPPRPVEAVASKFGSDQTRRGLFRGKRAVGVPALQPGTKQGKARGLGSVLRGAMGWRQNTDGFMDICNTQFPDCSSTIQASCNYTKVDSGAVGGEPEVRSDGITLDAIDLGLPPIETICGSSGQWPGSPRRKLPAGLSGHQPGPRSSPATLVPDLVYNAKERRSGPRSGNDHRRHPRRLAPIRRRREIFYTIRARAFIQAAAKGKMSTCVQMLVCRDPINVNVQDDMGRTALHLAAEERHYALFVILKSFGARDDIKDTFGATALSIALLDQGLREIYNAST